MKSFDKIKILDNINNIEIKKTINKFLDGLVSMEKNYKEVFVSNFFTPLEFKYVKRILKNLNWSFLKQFLKVHFVVNHEVFCQF